MIEWHAFTWDAFATITGSAATLMTGLAAVFAAYLIGRRQVEISERQTLIQDRQVKLQELTLNSDLFDKRMAVLSATQSYVNALAYKDKINVSVVKNFERECLSSRYLFDENIYNAIMMISGLCNVYEMMKERQVLESITDKDFIRQKSDIYTRICNDYTDILSLFEEIGVADRAIR